MRLLRSALLVGMVWAVTESLTTLAKKQEKEHEIRGYITSRANMLSSPVEKGSSAADKLVNLFQPKGDISTERSTVTYSSDEKMLLRRIRSSVVTSHNFTMTSHWQSWSNCTSAACGKLGKQHRTRNCSREHQSCYEATMQVRSCTGACNKSRENQSFSFSGSWNSWTNWSSCSASCGLGIQKRYRNCSGFEFANCLEHSEEQRPCVSLMACPTWSVWSTWSSCSLSCGRGGLRYRTRHCTAHRTEHAGISPQNFPELLNISSALLNRILRVVNTSRCEGGVEMSEELEPCLILKSCQQQHWTQWGQWTGCSVTCGMGLTSSSRVCNGSSLLAVCTGKSLRNRRCYKPPCWSEWSEFSSCSKTCGAKDGIQTRTRTCLHTASHTLFYNQCEGGNRDTVPCGSQSCSIWGEWSDFTECSSSCGGGTKVRARTCLREYCRGRGIEVTSCNYQPCPHWSKWSTYSCCSVSCGTDGVMERTRKCLHATQGGSGCTGESMEQTTCTLRPCNTTSTSVFESFECGVRSFRLGNNTQGLFLKIIRGKDSVANSWPWQASWQHRGCATCVWRHFCGATLIAPLWVVTAGHCTEESIYSVEHENPGDFWSVVLGMQQLHKNGERFFIRQVFVHPNYAYSSVTSADLSLLKLQRSATTSDSIRPICLPQLTRLKPGEKCYVTGWGYTRPHNENGAALATNLQEAMVPVMDFKRCQKLGDRYADLLQNKTHMCAGDPGTAAADSCTGDSGGPLSCRREHGRWYLGGVTSFGFTKCGLKGHVGIYVPLAPFENWLRNIIENYSFDAC